MAHTNWKQKHSQAIRVSFNKTIHAEELTNIRASEKVKENFYRPAYGKIGERREEKDEDSV